MLQAKWHWQRSRWCFISLFFPWVIIPYNIHQHPPTPPEKGEATKKYGWKGHSTFPTISRLLLGHGNNSKEEKQRYSQFHQFNPNYQLGRKGTEPLLAVVRLGPPLKLTYPKVASREMLFTSISIVVKAQIDLKPLQRRLLSHKNTHVLKLIIDLVSKNFSIFSALEVFSVCVRSPVDRALSSLSLCYLLPSPLPFISLQPKNMNRKPPLLATCEHPYLFFIQRWFLKKGAWCASPPHRHLHLPSIIYHLSLYLSNYQSSIYPL